MNVSHSLERVGWGGGRKDIGGKHALDVKLRFAEYSFSNHLQAKRNHHFWNLNLHMVVEQKKSKYNVGYLCALN